MGCVGDDGCPGAQVCDLPSGACREAPGGACDDDVDCLGDRICLLGFCDEPCVDPDHPCWCFVQGWGTPCGDGRAAAGTFEACIEQACGRLSCGDVVSCNHGGSLYALPLGPPALVNNGDQTATDPRTGLQWRIAVTAAGTYAAGKAACSQAFAGQSDWRVPDIYELLSIVDLARPVGPWLVEPLAATAGLQWASSVRAANPTENLLMNPGGSSPTLASTTRTFDNARVRCVRGWPPPAEGATAERFRVYEPVRGQPLVEDTVTGLIWQKRIEFPEGTYAQAADYCDASLNYGGIRSAWRLPTVHEGMSIVSDRRAGPPVIPDVFETAFGNNRWGLVWTSTPRPDGGSRWYVNHEALEVGASAEVLNRRSAGCVTGGHGG